MKEIFLIEVHNHYTNRPKELTDSFYIESSKLEETKRELISQHKEFLDVVVKDDDNDKFVRGECNSIFLACYKGGLEIPCGFELKQLAFDDKLQELKNNYKKELQKLRTLFYVK